MPPKRKRLDPKFLRPHEAPDPNKPWEEVLLERLSQVERDFDDRMTSAALDDDATRDDSVNSSSNPFAKRQLLGDDLVRAMLDVVSECDHGVAAAGSSGIVLTMDALKPLVALSVPLDLCRVHVPRRSGALPLQENVSSSELASILAEQLARGHLFLLLPDSLVDSGAAAPSLHATDDHIDDPASAGGSATTSLAHPALLSELVQLCYRRENESRAAAAAIAPSLAKRPPAATEQVIPLCHLLLRHAVLLLARSGEEMAASGGGDAVVVGDDADRRPVSSLVLRDALRRCAWLIASMLAPVTDEPTSYDCDDDNTACVRQDSSPLLHRQLVRALSALLVRAARLDRGDFSVAASMLGAVAERSAAGAGSAVRCFFWIVEALLTSGETQMIRAFLQAVRIALASSTATGAGDDGMNTADEDEPLADFLGACWPRVVGAVRRRILALLGLVQAQQSDAAVAGAVRDLCSLLLVDMFVPMCTSSLLGAGSTPFASASSSPTAVKTAAARTPPSSPAFSRPPNPQHQAAAKDVVETLVWAFTALCGSPAASSRLAASRIKDGVGGEAFRYFAVALGSDGAPPLSMLAPATRADFIQHLLVRGAAVTLREMASGGNNSAAAVDSVCNGVLCAFIECACGFFQEQMLALGASRSDEGNPAASTLATSLVQLVSLRRSTIALALGGAMLLALCCSSTSVDSFLERIAAQFHGLDELQELLSCLLAADDGDDDPDDATLDALAFVCRWAHDAERRHISRFYCASCSRSNLGATIVCLLRRFWAAERVSELLVFGGGSSAVTAHAFARWLCEQSAADSGGVVDLTAIPSIGEEASFASVSPQAQSPPAHPASSSSGDGGSRYVGAPCSFNDILSSGSTACVCSAAEFTSFCAELRLRTTATAATTTTAMAASSLSLSPQPPSQDDDASCGGFTTVSNPLPFLHHVLHEQCRELLKARAWPRVAELLLCVRSVLLHIVDAEQHAAAKFATAASDSRHQPQERPADARRSVLGMRALLLEELVPRFLASIAALFSTRRRRRRRNDGGVCEQRHDVVFAAAHDAVRAFVEMAFALDALAAETESHVDELQRGGGMLLPCLLETFFRCSMQYWRFQDGDGDCDNDDGCRDQQDHNRVAVAILSGFCDALFALSSQKQDRHNSNSNKWLQHADRKALASMFTKALRSRRQQLLQTVDNNAAAVEANRSFVLQRVIATCVVAALQSAQVASDFSSVLIASAAGRGDPLAATLDMLAPPSSSSSSASSSGSFLALQLLSRLPRDLVCDWLAPADIQDDTAALHFNGARLRRVLSLLSATGVSRDVVDVLYQLSDALSNCVFFGRLPPERRAAAAPASRVVLRMDLFRSLCCCAAFDFALFVAPATSVLPQSAAANRARGVGAHGAAAPEPAATVSTADLFDRVDRHLALFFQPSREATVASHRLAQLGATASAATLHLRPAQHALLGSIFMTPDLLAFLHSEERSLPKTDGGDAAGRVACDGNDNDVAAAAAAAANRGADAAPPPAAVRVPLSLLHASTGSAAGAAAAVEPGEHEMFWRAVTVADGVATACGTARPLGTLQSAATLDMLLVRCCTANRALRFQHASDDGWMRASGQFLREIGELCDAMSTSTSNGGILGTAAPTPLAALRRIYASAVAIPHLVPLLPRTSTAAVPPPQLRQFEDRVQQFIHSAAGRHFSPAHALVARLLPLSGTEVFLIERQGDEEQRLESLAARRRRAAATFSRAQRAVEARAAILLPRSPSSSSLSPFGARLALLCAPSSPFADATRRRVPLVNWARESEHRMSVWTASCTHIDGRRRANTVVVQLPLLQPQLFACVQQSQTRRVVTLHGYNPLLCAPSSAAARLLCLAAAGQQEQEAQPRVVPLVQLLSETGEVAAAKRVFAASFDAARQQLPASLRSLSAIRHSNGHDNNSTLSVDEVAAVLLDSKPTIGSSRWQLFAQCVPPLVGAAGGLAAAFSFAKWAQIFLCDAPALAGAAAAQRASRLAPAPAIDYSVAAIEDMVRFFGSCGGGALARISADMSRQHHRRQSSDGRRSTRDEVCRVLRETEGAAWCISLAASLALQHCASGRSGAVGGACLLFAAMVRHVAEASGFVAEAMTALEEESGTSALGDDSNDDDDDTSQGAAAAAAAAAAVVAPLAPPLLPALRAWSRWPACTIALLQRIVAQEQQRRRRTDAAVAAAASFVVDEHDALSMQRVRFETALHRPLLDFGEALWQSAVRGFGSARVPLHVTDVSPIGHTVQHHAGWSSLLMGTAMHQQQQQQQQTLNIQLPSRAAISACNSVCFMLPHGGSDSCVIAADDRIAAKFTVRDEPHFKVVTLYRSDGTRVTAALLQEAGGGAGGDDDAAVGRVQPLPLRAELYASARRAESIPASLWLYLMDSASEQCTKSESSFSSCTPRQFRINSDWTCIVASDERDDGSGSGASATAASSVRLSSLAEALQLKQKDLHRVAFGTSRIGPAPGQSRTADNVSGAAAAAANGTNSSSKEDTWVLRRRRANATPQDRFALELLSSNRRCRQHLLDTATALLVAADLAARGGVALLLSQAVFATRCFLSPALQQQQQQQALLRVTDNDGEGPESVLASAPPRICFRPLLSYRVMQQSNGDDDDDAAGPLPPVNGDSQFHVGYAVAHALGFGGDGIGTVAVDAASQQQPFLEAFLRARLSLRRVQGSSVLSDSSLLAACPPPLLARALFAEDVAVAPPPSRQPQSVTRSAAQGLIEAGLFADVRKSHIAAAPFSYMSWI